MFGTFMVSMFVTCRGSMFGTFMVSMFVTCRGSMFATPIRSSLRYRPPRRRGSRRRRVPAHGATSAAVRGPIVVARWSLHNTCPLQLLLQPPRLLLDHLLEILVGVHPICSLDRSGIECLALRRAQLVHLDVRAAVGPLSAVCDDLPDVSMIAGLREAGLHELHVPHVLPAAVPHAHH